MSRDWRNMLEASLFGVCSKIGERLGIPTVRVRLYFIYLSFLTFGSPVIFYLFTAFWLNVKKYIRRHRNVIWD